MFPAMPEDELQQAEWHLAVDRWHIARQREIVGKMRALGMRTDLVERVLATLIDMQVEHETRRARLHPASVYAARGPTG